MRADDLLDERLAGALRVPQTVDDRALADVVARCAGLPAPRSAEAVAVLAQAARAAGRGMAPYWSEWISSAHVASYVEMGLNARVPHAIVCRGVKDLGLPADEPEWRLGECLYDCFVDAGLVCPA